MLPLVRVSALRGPCVLLALLSVAAGCSSVSGTGGDALIPKLASWESRPRLSLSTETFAGSALTGTLPETEGVASLDKALPVDVRLILLRPRLDTGLAPIEETARLVSATTEGRPVMPSVVLAGGGRVGAAPGLAAFEQRLKERSPEGLLELETLHGAVFTGSTASFRLVSLPGIEPGPDGTLQRGGERVEIDVSRVARDDGGRLIFSVRVDSFVDGESVSERVIVEEVAEPSGDSQQALKYALSIPAPFADAREADVLALVRVGAEQAVETLPLNARYSAQRAARQLASNAAQTRQRTVSLAEGEWKRRELELTLAGLEEASSLRSSWLFLASETDAPLASEIALSASDELLRATGVRLLGIVRGSQEPLGPQQLSWALDASVLLQMAHIADEDGLPAELAAILLRHTGEVGRDPDLVRQVVRRSRSLEQCRAALVEENFMLLQDNSPASRVRAAEWLRRSGMSLVGFTALASREERRAALMELSARAETGVGAEERR